MIISRGLGNMCRPLHLHFSITLRSFCRHYRSLLEKRREGPERADGPEWLVFTKCSILKLYRRTRAQHFGNASLPPRAPISSGRLLEREESNDARQKIMHIPTIRVCTGVGTSAFFNCYYSTVANGCLSSCYNTQPLTISCKTLRHGFL